MPAVPFDAFTGGMYQALSPIMGSDQAVNVFQETRQVPGSAKQRVLYGTPGMAHKMTLPTLPMRGLFTQDGRTWAVSGSELYELDLDANTYTARGTIANDGFPVSFASNGRGGDQLGIVGGGSLYVLDLNTNVLTTAVLPFSNPVMIAFIDGYGLINQADTPVVWFSALEDFTSWDPLDFFTRSSTSDNIVGITVTRSRVWALGSKTTTLFYDSGDTDTPFVPWPSSDQQIGLINPWLLTLYADQVFWMGRSSKGDIKVYLSGVEGGAQIVSTPPIELWLANATSLEDAELLAYAQAGHVFFAITAPSSNNEIKTYVYDLAENVWHARAGWNDTTGEWQRWHARGSTASGSQIIIGHYDTGDICQLDLYTYDDLGDMIRRQRTCPFTSEDASTWTFVDQFELGIQSGVGLISGQGSDPVVTLEVSRDGGRTWVNAGNASLGQMGQYQVRCRWRRLGRFRSDLMLFRVTQSDPVKTVWTTPIMRLEQGGQM